MTRPISITSPRVEPGNAGNSTTVEADGEHFKHIPFVLRHRGAYQPILSDPSPLMTKRLGVQLICLTWLPRP